jgi:hypothetical protein
MKTLPVFHAGKAGNRQTRVYIASTLTGQEVTD